MFVLNFVANLDFFMLHYFYKCLTEKKLKKPISYHFSLFNQGLIVKTKTFYRIKTSKK